MDRPSKGSWEAYSGGLGLRATAARHVGRHAGQAGLIVSCSHCSCNCDIRAIVLLKWLREDARSVRMRWGSDEKFPDSGKKAFSRQHCRIPC